MTARLGNETSRQPLLRPSSSAAARCYRGQRYSRNVDLFTHDLQLISYLECPHPRRQCLAASVSTLRPTAEGQRSHDKE